MEMQISKILLFKKKKKDYLFPQVNYKEKRRDEERLARLKSLNDIPTWSAFWCKLTHWGKKIYDLYEITGNSNTL